MRLLATRLLDHARDTPRRVALAHAQAVLDYGALADAASRFAAMLRARGVSAGDRVALVLPNRLEAVVATYGAWLAGAAIVPLNAQARVRDFVPWLRHAGARLVVVESTHPDGMLASAELAADVQRLVLDAPDAGPSTDWRAMLAMDPLPEPCAVAHGALAAILYTSGTTGAPKGVALSHANFASNVDAILAYLELGAGDSTVSVLPFYYAYGASVLHTHLAIGARLVIESNLVFPHLVVGTLARERATGFSGVPSTFALLLDRAAFDGHDLSALRYLTQAGGAMPVALGARLRAALPQASVFVMYGQTEATARLTWLPPEQFEAKAGSVGRAIDGVELQVRDEHGDVLAADAEGEVWARGPGVMTGYWNDAEASARVLHDGWLRTGDEGRLDADGFLYLAGRRSDIIKTGAHRVHPLDVEEAIAEVDGVAEVAVAGVEDATLGQAIKAFVVRAQGAELDADRIRAHCRARLATYKVPRQVDFVEALPKTASGKVRRAHLATPPPLQEAP